MSLFSDAREWLSRRLQEGEPQTYIEGGGNIDGPEWGRDKRHDRDRLDTFESVYREGGPVAALIDTRANMVFGTGTEFQSEQSEVEEWLEDAFAERDNLLVDIGRDSYVYGDSLAELVETRGGDFSHVELVNPKTMEPKWDDRGQIQQWEQFISRRGVEKQVASFDADDIAHFAVKRVGRTPLGISLIGQNWDEVNRFVQNQEALANAIKIHGHPKYHVKVGPEGGQAIDDREVKRVRDRFRPQSTDEKTNWVTGRDIDIEMLDVEGGINPSEITEHDLMLLAAAFGVPEEMVGLGRGSTEATAKVRLQAFERMARAEQRALADQVVEQVIRPVLDEYSPFPRDVDVTLSFDDVVSDQTATAEWLEPFKDIYTVDEMRKKLGDAPFDGDEEELGPPESDDGGGEGGNPFGGMMEAGERDLEAAESGPRRSLLATAVETEGDLWEEELVWLRIHDRVHEAGPERALFQFDDEEVPDFVVERLEEAVREGALFDDFETVPDWARDSIRDTMLDSLEEQHGWSLRSISNNLQEAVDTLDQDEAERIARTETNALVNQAREDGYRERADVDEHLFKWTGPSDSRTTEACEWLEEQSRDGVPLDELKELVAEANDRFVDHAGREWTPHINCRHTYVRKVD